MPKDTAQRQAEGAQQAAPLAIPRSIKRNTILLALSQAFVGSGTQMVPALGAIMVVQLTGSATLAGLGTSLAGVSRFLVAYPLGRIMDRHGRRAGLILGFALGLVGAILTGFCITLQSLPLFVAGMLVFGMGMSAGQQLRIAASDMYPPARRAEGLGFVLTGSLIGALGGPVIISVAQSLAPRWDIDPLALPWLLVPAVILSGIVLVWQIRPDPRDIAAHLERYYPGYVAPASTQQQQGAAGLGDLFREYPRLVAAVACFASQGNMVLIMAMTSLILNYHGHALPAISLSVAIHVLGMYAFSLPLGKLCDRVGRRLILLGGVIISAIGALVVPISPAYAVITLGTFLVGVGWSCVNVAATTVIADTTPALWRGRAVGMNDTLANAAGIALPLLGGPLLQSFGLYSVGAVGAALMIVPLVFILRLREDSPGSYTRQRVAAKR